jgi:hypothetical protein
MEASRYSQIMQIHCIYPTPAPGLSQEHRCDAEATTPSNQIEFGTHAKASGLLRACHQSRQIVLKVFDGCIESGHRKIRFNMAHDVILLHTTKACCDRGLPGIYSRPETLPNYRQIFNDVQQPALCDYTLAAFAKEQLHSATQHVYFDSSRPWLLSQFRSLRTLYLLPNDASQMQDYQDIAGEPMLQTFEEIASFHETSCSGFIRLQNRVEYHQLVIDTILKRYKTDNKLEDWEIPHTKHVALTKAVPLGENKWERLFGWAGQIRLS